ncbi:MAG: MlaD family protein [Rickettsiales bacterium]|jgi:phospholipid/cholesterol/gamma-HCH transport system substrate-binding protein|nr:MlaD family protein [Rickettsiales bacterium]
MKKNNKEAIFGILSVLFLILVFVSFNGYKLQKASGRTVSYKALFNNIEGVKKGTEVRYSGISVGTVSDIELKDNYMVEVTIKMTKKYEVPQDSVLSVATDGIIGAKYLEIAAGSDDSVLKSGEYFEDSVSSSNIMALVMQILQRVSLK